LKPLSDFTLLRVTFLQHRTVLRDNEWLASQRIIILYTHGLVHIALQKTTGTFSACGNSMLRSPSTGVACGVRASGRLFEPS